MSTILPPNQFDSGVPSASTPDEAAASSRSHAPGAAADIQSSCGGQWPTDEAPTLGSTLNPPSSSVASGHGIDPTDPQETIDSKQRLLAAIEDDYRFKLNEEKFLFDIGCVPDDFAKYMAMLEQLTDNDEPPLFIQEARRA